MTSPQNSPQPAGLSWPLILGLSSLALLWPLTAVTGLGDSGAPRALAVVGATAIVWIGVVGLGRVPRPILTLTLTGIAHGLVAALTGLLVPAFAGSGPGGGELWTLPFALATDAVWGFVTGLLAAGVQRVRGAR